MPQAGFEPTIRMFDRSKTILILHYAATGVSTSCPHPTLVLVCDMRSRFPFLPSANYVTTSLCYLLNVVDA
jgi:hypothetical protein